jgi:AcrR family transcriptional regulator
MVPTTDIAGDGTDTTERDRIARRAQDLFFRNGFSRVTTDDVARELGISKKTLYQHFASKEELLRASVALMREEIQTAVHEIVGDRRRDFVEKLQDLLTAVVSRMSRIQRPFVEDLPRKAPEIWAELEEFRQRVVFTEIAALIQQGSRRGMIRRDVDPHLFVLMFLNTMRTVMTPESIAELSLSAAEVFRTIMSVFMQGVLTDDARERFGGAS